MIESVTNTLEIQSFKSFGLSLYGNPHTKPNVGKTIVRIFMLITQLRTLNARTKINHCSSWGNRRLMCCWSLSSLAKSKKHILSWIHRSRLHALHCTWVPARQPTWKPFAENCWSTINKITTQINITSPTSAILCLRFGKVRTDKGGTLLKPRHAHESAAISYQKEGNPQMDISTSSLE